MNQKNEIDDLLENMDDQETTIKEPKKKKQKKEKKRRLKLYQKILIIVGSIILALGGTGAFLLYGPWPYIRETLITTAMTTMTHQYLAKWFYSDATIEKVLAKHKVIESGDSTNPDLIDIKDPGKNQSSTMYESIYEEQVLKKDKDNDLFKVIPISGKSYQGHLVVVYDPSKVSIATTKYLRTQGQYITTVAKDNNARIALNAGGFYDPDWNSNGALPHGTVIQNGKVVSDYDDAPVGGGFIGFTKDNKFVLGKMTIAKALEIGMRDAIEFGPFLIVNGKPSFIKGNGGWGIAPRTAIGQRKDGIVLMLAIDGRLANSIGADMVDLTEIMQRYGAYNAANMDGGSSTALVIDNKIINHPVAAGPNGLRPMPTFWIVKD